MPTSDPVFSPVPAGAPPVGAVPVVGMVNWACAGVVDVPSGAVWVTVMLWAPWVKGWLAWQFQVPSDVTVVEQTGFPESWTATV